LQKKKKKKNPVLFAKYRFLSPISDTQSESPKEELERSKGSISPLGDSYYQGGWEKQ
jgi:hypothetical protein